MAGEKVSKKLVQIRGGADHLSILAEKNSLNARWLTVGKVEGNGRGVKVELGNHTTIQERTLYKSW